MPTELTSTAVGVDFGTTTSFVARAEALQRRIVPLGHSQRWMPSTAAQTQEGLIVGEDAEAAPAGEVIRSIKRMITENKTTVDVNGVDGPYPVDADAVIIAVLSELATRAKSRDVPLTDPSELRLGCPAMWDGDQRRRLLQLARKAGINVSDATLIDEPIAAGIAWVADRTIKHGERIGGRLLTFDMGGGTLDIAVLDVVGRVGDTPEISVLTALGSSQAGDLLDETIAADLMRAWRAAGIDFEAQHRPAVLEAIVRLAAREAKIALSVSRDHTVVMSTPYEHLPALAYSREQLEDAFRPQMDDAERRVWAAVRAARVSQTDPSGTSAYAPASLRRLTMEDLAGDIDYVLLAGGMSRIPYVERRLGQLFPRAEIYRDAGGSPEEAIVAGLADTQSYERLNLHRPGFDFVIDWTVGMGGRRTVYEAYTPFYSRAEAMRESILSYERRGRDLDLPTAGHGVLRVVSVGDEPIRLRIDGKDMDGLRVNFGRHEWMFKLYPDGRLIVRDGLGKVVQLRVDKWPVIRGRDHATLVLKRPPTAASSQPTPWYWDKEYAPPGIR